MESSESKNRRKTPDRIRVEQGTGLAYCEECSTENEPTADDFKINYLKCGGCGDIISIAHLVQ